VGRRDTESVAFTVVCILGRALGIMPRRTRRRALGAVSHEALAFVGP
jgi:hypothetical protein